MYISSHNYYSSVNDNDVHNAYGNYHSYWRTDYYHVMYIYFSNMHCMFTIIIVLNSLLVYFSTQLFLYYACE